MNKAYDRVEWDILQLGFQARWVSMVMTCVKTVSFSVTFNGKYREKFIPSRGMRQGDPLSLYLFLFITEALSSLISDHCEANQDNCNALLRILDLYNVSSGQSINLQKSSIFFSANTLQTRIAHKIPSWKLASLSLVGHEVLIKVVAMAIPTYLMNCLGQRENKHKIHWQKWQAICASKFVGSLGFRNLIDYNTTLLAK
ncbi:hypothetical protein ACFX2I_000022 [Malus domestica]